MSAHSSMSSEAQCGLSNYADSTGKFYLTIDNVNKFCDIEGKKLKTVSSKSLAIAGLAFRVRVDSKRMLRNTRHLEIFVVCVERGLAKNFKCSIHATLTLHAALASVDKVAEIKKEINSKQMSCGVKQFISFSKVLSGGFISSNSIQISAIVKVSDLCGVERIELPIKKCPELQHIENPSVEKSSIETDLPTEKACSSGMGKKNEYEANNSCATELLNLCYVCGVRNRNHANLKEKSMSSFQKAKGSLEKNLKDALDGLGQLSDKNLKEMEANIRKKDNEIVLLKEATLANDDNIRAKNERISALETKLAAVEAALKVSDDRLRVADTSAKEKDRLLEEAEIVAEEKFFKQLLAKDRLLEAKENELKRMKANFEGVTTMLNSKLEEKDKEIQRHREDLQYKFLRFQKEVLKLD